MKKILSETTLYTSSLLTALIIAYVFHMVATRFLGISGYAEFSRYFGILLFLTIPTTTIQSFVAREIARGKNCAGYIMKVLLYFLIPISLLFIFMGKGYLPISLFIFLYVLSIYRGILQGKFRKFSLSFNLIIEPVVRVIFLIIFLKIGLGFVGALLAFGVGYLFALTPGIKTKYGKEKVNIKPILSFVFVSIIIFYPTSITLYIASNYLQTNEMSAFSLIILISKVLIFISLALGMAYLPRAVKGRRSLLPSSLILIISSLPLIFFPKVATFFFPKFYSTYFIRYLPLASVSMLLIGISYLLINQLWSKGKDWIILIPGSIYIISQTIFSTSRSLNIQIYGLFISSLILLTILLISKGFLILRRSSF